MAGKLKLYVWEDVLSDYTSGVMFALAPDLETAMRLIRETKVTAVEDELGKPYKVYDAPVGFALWGGG